MPLVTAVCFFLVLLVYETLPVLAGTPPASPFVRVNAPLHAAKIKDIASNHDGTILATASFDKSVKLWQATTGELLTTLRPPIGAGIEGVLHAVALTPDGRTVAAAGWTGGSWDGSFSVYLFDAATGEMRHRFSGFPKPVSRLAFSPDAKQLAIGLHSSGGLYLVNSPDGRRIVTAPLQGSCAALAYGRDGSLIAASDSGFINRYRSDGVPLYSVRTEGRSTVLDAALSPDGKQLALVYKDFNLVEVRSAIDGRIDKVLKRPGGKFMSVAWSGDGTQIYAAGHNKTDDERKVLMVWSADSGHFDELVALPAKTGISRLLVLPDGQVAFVSQLSGFGLLNVSGTAVVSKSTFVGRGPQKGFTVVERKQAYYHALAVADFFKNHDLFRVSPDASSVLFSYDRYGMAPARFDLKKRRLTVTSPMFDGLLPRRGTADGIDVQNWNGAAAPRLNRTVLKGFAPQETSWSLAVRTDEQGFVLGTNLYARHYSRKGDLLWKMRIPYTMRNIALSADDRTLVAALDDGSIRWYRMATGEEQYAFFPHPDRKRWMLWTPDGFFDHGTGSDNLIGFQVNRGADRSSVMVGTDRLFDLLYRPDLLDKAISGEDLAPYLNRLMGRVSGYSRSGVESRLRQDDRTYASETAVGKMAEERRIREAKAADEKKRQQPEQASLTKVPLQDEEEETPVDAMEQPVLDAAKTALAGLVTEATLPPKVRFQTLSGTSQNRDLTIKAELCDSGGGIGNVTLFLNRMPIVFEQSGRGLVARSKGTSGCTRFERIITLASGDNIISLMAFNSSNSIESEHDQITIRYTSPVPLKPRLRLLAIAVNNYREKNLQLKYAVHDAEALVRLVAEKGKQLFADIHTYRLYDEQVTRAGLDNIFAVISKEIQRGDVFLLFVAGHGLTDELEGMYYFLPSDFQLAGLQSLSSNAISIHDFKQYASSVQAMKSLFLIDTCNSGAFSEGMASAGITENTALGKLARSVGRATIAASSRNQVALEGYQGHGVFSYTVLEALKGEAANRKGQITINGLATFIEETLPELTYKKWGYEQIPQKTLVGSDFSIGIK